MKNRLEEIKTIVQHPAFNDDFRAIVKETDEYVKALEVLIQKKDEALKAICDDYLHPDDYYEPVLVKVQEIAEQALALTIEGE